MKLKRDTPAEFMCPSGPPDAKYYIARFELFAVRVSQDKTGCSWAITTQAGRGVVMGDKTYATPELAYSGAIDYAMSVLLANAKAEIEAEQKELTQCQ